MGGSLGWKLHGTVGIEWLVGWLVFLFFFDFSFLLTALGNSFLAGKLHDRQQRASETL